MVPELRWLRSHAALVRWDHVEYFCNRFLVKEFSLYVRLSIICLVFNGKTIGHDQSSRSSVSLAYPCSILQ